MRLRVVVAIAVGIALATPARASEPGERIGPEDIVFSIDGLKAESFLGPSEPVSCTTADPPNPLLCARLIGGNGLDAEGTYYYDLNRSECEIWGLRPDGELELVAQLLSRRENNDGSVDSAFFGGLYIDPVNGFLYVRVTTDCRLGSPCTYPLAHEMIRIDGLKPLAEALKEQKRGHGRPEQPW